MRHTCATCTDTLVQLVLYRHTCATCIDTLVQLVLCIDARRKCQRMQGLGDLKSKSHLHVTSPFVTPGLLLADRGKHGLLLFPQITANESSCNFSKIVSGRRSTKPTPIDITYKLLPLLATSGTKCCLYWLPPRHFSLLHSL